MGRGNESLFTGSWSHYMGKGEKTMDILETISA